MHKMIQNKLRYCFILFLRRKRTTLSEMVILVLWIKETAFAKYAAETTQLMRRIVDVVVPVHYMMSAFSLVSR